MCCTWYVFVAAIKVDAAHSPPLLAREAHQQRWRRCGVDLDEVDAEEGGYTRYTYNGKGWEVVYKIPVYTRGYHITYLQVYII